MKRVVLIVLIVGILLGSLTTFSASARPNVDDVRANHEQSLLAIQGVTGVASDKTRNEIVVLVENAADCAKIPKTLDGIGVRCVATGRIEALPPAATAKPTPKQTGYTRTGPDRPVFGGISVGSSAYPGSAGTLGLVVPSGKSELVLSCAHVLAMNSFGMLVNTANTWQPGGYDGGTAANTIGTLTKHTTIQFNNPRANNYADAAYATLSSSSIGTPNVVLNAANNGFNTVSGTSAVSHGDTVYKSGRTTGVTSNTVEYTNVTVQVWYTQREYALFKDQIVIYNPNSTFGAAGSGSAIYNVTGQFVGLLFAGSTGPSGITVANSAARVESALGITI
jgi:hypothetical protein